MPDTHGLSRSVALRRPARWTTPLLAGVAVALLAWALAALGAGANVTAAAADPMRSLTSFTTVFLGIFVEAVPFVLLGVLVSSAIHLFVDERLIGRISPRRALPASLAGGLLGLAFPVCECGVVPVSRRLMWKGASVSLGVAFLLAAPVINPVVIAATWVAFGGDWRIVAWRVGLTLVIAVAIGLVFALHPAPRSLLLPTADAADGHDHDGPSHAEHNHHDHRHEGAGDRARALLWHTGTEFVEMSRYLILGALLAAAMQTFVPRSTLLALGDTPLAAVLVMIALAVVLSICSTVDAFIALAFAGIFGVGPVLAFLVFGPMIDIKSTLMLLGVFQRRAVAVIVLLVFQMVLLASLFISYTWD